MSKIHRQQFQKKWQMPSWKIMGRISDSTAQHIKNLVMQGDSSANDKIFKELNTLLDATVYDISADLYTKPFDSGKQRSQNYDEPTGVFVLPIMGNLKIEMTGDEKPFNVGEKQVAFVDERHTYRIYNDTNKKVIIMSGRFLWNPKTALGG